MHHFAYRGGVLHAEDVDLRDIAAAVGTPLYCYSTATLERHYRVFKEAFGKADVLVCYSAKANSNQAVIKTLARLGAGIDIVSAGELKRALAAGVPGERIVFSGVGKTKDDMAAGLAADVLSFNVESEDELKALSEVADAMGRTASCRCASIPTWTRSPTPRSPPGDSTTSSASRFPGPGRLCKGGALPGIRVTGVDMHIGSQIVDLKPVDDAARLIADLARTLMADGHRLHHVDFGGGLGIPYRADNDPPPDPAAYASTILRHAGDLGLKFLFEPGRLIAGNAGILVTRVIYVKPGEGKTVRGG